MNIIFFIVLIFLVILFLASSVVLSIVRWVLSLIGLVPGAKSRRGTSEGGTQRMYHTRAGDASSNGGATTSGWHYSPEAELKRKKRKKIIQQDEGEYVDYEEIKKRR